MSSHGHSHGGGGSHGHSHGGEHEHEQVPAPQNFLEACMCGAMGVVVAFWSDGCVAIRDQNGATGLHWAAVRGHAHIVRMLLDNGADANAADHQKQTPLHWACSAPSDKVPGQVETIHALLDGGADALARDAMQSTPHGSCAVNDNLAALHALSSRAPPPPNLLDADGNTPLAWACYRGRLDIARYCHEVLGIPANTVGKFKRTPLHWAAREGHADCCQYLVGLGLDPAQPDEGDARSAGTGFSAIHWAEDRNHYEALRVLRARATGVPDRNWGTVRALFADLRNHALHAALFAVIILVSYAAMLVLPPAALGVCVSFYFSKNTIYMMERKPAVVSHRAETSIAEAIGMPKDVDEAVEGPKFMHRREIANMLLLPAIIALQLYTVVNGSPTWIAQWTASHALYDEGSALAQQHKAAGGGSMFVVGAVSQTLVWALLLAKVFGGIAKALSGRNVLPSGSPRDFPLWRAIDERQYEDVAAGAAIFDSRVWLRKPARAGFCEQLGVVIKRFDGWSNILDAPLSAANLRWFCGLLLALIVAQSALLKAAWDHNMTANGCAASAAAATSHGADDGVKSTAGGAAAAAFHGWCTIVASLVLNAAPCPSKHSWLGGAPWSSLSWRELLLGSDATHTGAVLIVLPCVVIVGLGYTLFKKLYHAANAVTEAEVRARVVPYQGGGVIPLSRPNGYGSVYGEGSAPANLLLFLIGRDGERWEGAMAVPAAQRPLPQPSPFVVPHDEARSKKRSRR